MFKRVRACVRHCVSLNAHVNGQEDAIAQGTDVNTTTDDKIQLSGRIHDRQQTCSGAKGLANGAMSIAPRCLLT